MPVQQGAHRPQARAGRQNRRTRTAWYRTEVEIQQVRKYSIRDSALAPRQQTCTLTDSLPPRGIGQKIMDRTPEFVSRGQVHHPTTGTKLGGNVREILHVGSCDDRLAEDRGLQKIVPAAPR